MKFPKILLLALACAPLAGCDFFGEKADTTLYELKLTSNIDKAKSDLRAELTNERDQDEIDMLLEDGAKQEDIDKAGTCVDGTYYFFAQDPINLYEPFLPGYEFLGWFDGTNWLGYIDSDYDGNPDNRWNMDDKNVTLEARFKMVTYTIEYMDEGVGPAVSTGNETTWNVEQPEIVLTHKDRTNEGLKFDGWTFAMGGASHYQGYVTKINAQFLVDSGVAKESTNGSGAMTFSLHENYSILKHTVKLTFDPTVVDYVIVDVTPIGQQTYSVTVNNSHFLSGGEVNAEIEHNAEVVIFPTLYNPDEYTIDGIFYQGHLISTEVSIRDGLSIAYKIIASQDAEVEIRCTKII